MYRRWLIRWLVGWGCTSNVVMAQPIPEGYQRVAAAYGLPPGLLYAVALTESGHRSGGEFRPWPWTLNIQGQGHYFTTRHLAWRALTTELRRRNHVVDVGLMQINWRYHHEALITSWQALDPYHNLRVAASILRRCAREHSDWLRSAGCYHAPNNAVRAKAYATRVQRHWSRLQSVQKVGDDERP